MINITNWIDSCQVKLKEVFDHRVWFFGLQGSYGRGEATETSDIDIVVILDELSVADIETYNAMVARLILSKCLKHYLLGAKISLQTTDNHTTFTYSYLHSAPFGYSFARKRPRLSDRQTWPFSN